MQVPVIYITRSNALDRLFKANHLLCYCLFLSPASRIRVYIPTSRHEQDLIQEFTSLVAKKEKFAQEENRLHCEWVPRLSASGQFLAQLGKRKAYMKRYTMNLFAATRLRLRMTSEYKESIRFDPPQGLRWKHKQ